MQLHIVLTTGTKLKIMGREILEVEIELGNGEKKSMFIQLCEDWYEIKKGTKGLICLVNNQQMFVDINYACEDEGVSFSIEKRSYHYDGNVVDRIYVEVDDE